MAAEAVPPSADAEAHGLGVVAAERAQLASLLTRLADAWPR